LRTDVLAVDWLTRGAILPAESSMEPPTLTPAEVTAIDALDTGARGGPDPELIDRQHYPVEVEN